MFYSTFRFRIYGLGDILLSCIPTTTPPTMMRLSGNDLSTLYAPIVRDGRMDKFYWEPSEDDVVNIVHQVGMIEFEK